MSNPTETAPEAKLQRIQALLDRASHEGTPPEEAESAMAKAMDMMAKYGVTEMMLAGLASTKNEEVIKVKIDLSGNYGSQRATLAHRIALPLNCKVVTTSIGRKLVHFHIVGYASDVRRVEMLYTSLLLQMINGVRHERPDTDRYFYTNVTVYRRNWMEGFAHRVGTRLDEAEQRARSAYDQTTDNGQPGTALVLRDRKKDVEDAFKVMFPNSRSRRSNNAYDPNARSAGDSAGRRANIGTTGLGGRRAQLDR